MSGCIECVAYDYLRQVIEAPEQASRVTAHDRVVTIEARPMPLLQARENDRAEVKKGKSLGSALAVPARGIQKFEADPLQEAARRRPARGQAC